jgi:hypothetical protein
MQGVIIEKTKYPLFKVKVGSSVYTTISKADWVLYDIGDLVHIKRSFLNTYEITSHRGLPVLSADVDVEGNKERVRQYLARNDTSIKRKFSRIQQGFLIAMSLISILIVSLPISSIFAIIPFTLMGLAIYGFWFDSVNLLNGVIERKPVDAEVLFHEIPTLLPGQKQVKCTVYFGYGYHVGSLSYLRRVNSSTLDYFSTYGSQAQNKFLFLRPGTRILTTLVHSFESGLDYLVPRGETFLRRR